MADEAPAENAPAAEGAGTNDVYTTPNGYQYYETLAMAHKKGGRVEILGTRRYMTGVPGAWAATTACLMVRTPKKDHLPLARRSCNGSDFPEKKPCVLKGSGKTSPFRSTQIGVRKRKSACPSQQVQRGQDLRRNSRVWSHGGRKAPLTTTKAFTLLRPIAERCFIAKACFMERIEVIINMVATTINDLRS